MEEYYELFPFSGSERLTAYYYSVLFNDDTQQRDFMVLRRMQNLKIVSDNHNRKMAPLVVPSFCFLVTKKMLMGGFRLQ